ncbi:MAG: hypothetical protein R3D89_07820 [Sphingomonadaceae bacterium]
MDSVLLATKVAALPVPAPVDAANHAMLVAGIGGTGVLDGRRDPRGMAAHLEARRPKCSTRPGWRKGGAVTSHIRIGASAEDPRRGLGTGQAFDRLRPDRRRGSPDVLGPTRGDTAGAGE